VELTFSDGNKQYAQIVKKVSAFMDPEDSLSRSQEPATGPYPKSHDSSPLYVSNNVNTIILYPIYFIQNRNIIPEVP
jgi:hypothetical protein